MHSCCAPTFSTLVISPFLHLPPISDSAVLTPAEINSSQGKALTSHSQTSAYTSVTPCLSPCCPKATLPLCSAFPSSRRTHIWLCALPAPSFTSAELLPYQHRHRCTQVVPIFTVKIKGSSSAPWPHVPFSEPPRCPLLELSALTVSSSLHGRAVASHQLQWFTPGPHVCEVRWSISFLPLGSADPVPVSPFWKHPLDFCDNTFLSFSQASLPISCQTLCQGTVPVSIPSTLETLGGTRLSSLVTLNTVARQLHLQSFLDSNYSLG